MQVVVDMQRAVMKERRRVLLLLEIGRRKTLFSTVAGDAKSARRETATGAQGGAEPGKALQQITQAHRGIVGLLSLQSLATERQRGAENE